MAADPSPAGLITDVAALFVDARGEYPKHFAHWFDEKRDARTYAGDLPVIAHPPCQRWCRLAGLVEARWGYKRGEDGGLFASALATVRRVGGVLEHPAYSDAWAAYGLPRPPTGGAWVQGAEAGEWTCYVEQWRYGHRAKKATWLYYVGLTAPPALCFGAIRDAAAAAGCAPWRDSNRRYTSTEGRVYGPTHKISALPIKQGTSGGSSLPRLSKREAIATSPEFREALIMLARHAVRG